MLYEPFRDNVFVLVQKEASVSPAGVIIMAKEPGSEHGAKLRVGKVLKVGPGTKDWPVDCKVGDRVLFDRLDGELCIVGQDIRAEHAPMFEPGTELRILRANEVICVLD